MAEDVASRPRWSIAPYFIVADVVAAADYYRDRLGFRYDRLWGEPPCFCMVYRSGVVIMLSQLGRPGLVLGSGRCGVGVPEQVPSSEWEPVQHMAEEVAAGWCKREGETFTYQFRVPRDRFEAADPSQPLTLETILEAAVISKDQVESWRIGDASEFGTDPEPGHPLPPPPPGETHLTVYVRVKPPDQLAARDEGGDQDMSQDQWQALEAVWKTTLGLEVSIDTLRLSMEGLRAEMEAAFKKQMGVEEKVHGLQADVAQWTKAKNRVHYALPKVREFIHRATWALAVPERKRLEEVVQKYIEPRIPHPHMDEVREQLGHFQKDRQVLYAQGNSVNQECRAILAEIQRAYGTLQRNAAERARAKRSTGREKGKYF